MGLEFYCNEVNYSLSPKIAHRSVYLDKDTSRLSFSKLGINVKSTGRLGEGSRKAVVLICGSSDSRNA